MEQVWITNAVMKGASWVIAVKDNFYSNSNHTFPIYGPKGIDKDSQVGSAMKRIAQVSNTQTQEILDVWYALT